MVVTTPHGAAPIGAAPPRLEFSPDGRCSGQAARHFLPDHLAISAVPASRPGCEPRHRPGAAERRPESSVQPSTRARLEAPNGQTRRFARCSAMVADAIGPTERRTSDRSDCSRSSAVAPAATDAAPAATLDAVPDGRETLRDVKVAQLVPLRTRCLIGGTPGTHMFGGEGADVRLVPSRARALPGPVPR